MSSESEKRVITRRDMLGTMGKAAAASVVLPPLSSGLIGSLAGGPFQEADLAAQAGPDRIVVLPGKTYINSWVGYGLPPNQRPRRRRGEPEPVPPQGGRLRCVPSRLDFILRCNNCGRLPHTHAERLNFRLFDDANQFNIDA